VRSRFLATTQNRAKDSPCHVIGAAISITTFVTIAYLVPVARRWIVSEVVLVFFAVVAINSLAGG
jgi:hypothetical protein